MKRTALMVQLTGIDHVGLKAADMDKTLEFYQRLGLTLLRSSGPNADGLRSAVVRVGNQELNIFSHPDFIPPGHAKAVGVDHFCLAVEAESVDEVVAYLGRAGIDVARGPVERRDATAIFVHDPDGVRVELQLKRPATT